MQQIIILADRGLYLHLLKGSILKVQWRLLLLNLNNMVRFKVYQIFSMVTLKIKNNCAWLTWLIQLTSWTFEVMLILGNDELDGKEYKLIMIHLTKEHLISYFPFMQRPQPANSKVR